MKDILFVDDERDLLDSLRARLYKHRHDWNMKFVVSGDEAISAFEQQPVDLIVSDVRMPGMDGGQLLSVVKERWPTAVRIIVSGYSDPVQAVRQLENWGLPYSIVEAVALHHSPGTITPHGYDLLGALTVSHALLESSGAHAWIASGNDDAEVNASYLAGLNAPFDWQEAQRRVQASASPTT